MMSLGLAFLRHCVHELPRIAESSEKELTLEAFLGRCELPYTQQLGGSIRQVLGLVCGEVDSDQSAG